MCQLFFDTVLVGDPYCAEIMRGRPPRVGERMGRDATRASPTVPKIWSPQSLSSSLIDVFDRVRSSTRLMITAQ